MSERTTNENVRRNRRRRLGRRLLSRNTEAVSPVVATLILILVAVAAAAALYLWLSGWQAGVTKGIGAPNAQYSITIGGSTTVYPFDQSIVPWFEQNNSAVVVSDNVGGSGAGILAVCAGQVDIGAASRALTATDIANCPALANAVQTRLGIAAIVPIVSSTTTTGFSATSGWMQAVLASIYEVNGGAVGFSPALITTPIVGGVDGLLAGAPNGACPAGDPGLAGKCYAWTDIPNNVGQGTCTVAGAFAGCTYGTGGVIHLYDRADNSGTEANFAAKLLGQSKCGSDGQIDSCGVKTSLSGGGSFTGNPAVTAAVGKDPIGLGFTDIGQATSAVIVMPFQNASQALPVLATITTIKAAAATGSSSPVAPFAGAYGGWTPLEYITIGAPTGEVQRLIQFAMNPNVNQVACALNGYVSVYS